MGSHQFDETQPVELRVLASHERLMIVVWDALPAPPEPQPHAIDADSGRGLEIVSLLSDRWGFYHPGGGGKVVWAALEIGSSPAARRLPACRGDDAEAGA
jgi:hypothetical protein